MNASEHPNAYLPLFIILVFKSSPPYPTLKAPNNIGSIVKYHQENLPNSSENTKQAPVIITASPILRILLSYNPP